MNNEKIVLSKKDKLRLFVVAILIASSMTLLLNIVFRSYEIPDKINECLKKHDLDYCNHNVK